MSLLLILPWVFLAAGCWIGFQLIRQNGRILLRLDALEERLSSLSGFDAAVMPPQSSSPRGIRALSESRIQREGLDAGTQAPEFTLPRLNGGEFSLSDFRGQRVLLVLSDPGCEPCMQLMPQLEAVRRRSPDLNVLMVSRGDVEDNRRKVAEFDLTFPVVLQKQWEISRRYGIFTTPVAYLIDERGVIAAGVAAGAAPILELAQRAAMLDAHA